MATQRDLPSEQVEVLRSVVARLCEKRGGQRRLADETGWDPANISMFLSGRQGVSYGLALKVCAVANVDAFEVLDLPRPPRFKALDVPMDEFLARLGVARGLSETVFKYPRRWKLSTVAQALYTPHPTDEQGIPIGGWAALLDSLEPGLPKADDADAGDERAPRARRKKAAARGTK